MIGASHRDGLRQIEHLDAADLRACWKERLGAPPPPTLTARLMRHALAWEVQSKTCRPISKPDQKSWSKLMQQRSQGNVVTASALPRAPASPGTRLLKVWGGITHEVVVREDAVTWNGQDYSSLSAVARAMTGTPRNGPRFFGLRG